MRERKYETKRKTETKIERGRGKARQRQRERERQTERKREKHRKKKRKKEKPFKLLNIRHARQQLKGAATHVILVKRSILARKPNHKAHPQYCLFPFSPKGDPQMRSLCEKRPINEICV